jgi:hypothetical protein
MPHALSPLIRRIAAAALAVVLAASAAMGQRAPDFDAWPEYRFRKRHRGPLRDHLGRRRARRHPGHRRPRLPARGGETALGPREPVLTYAPEGEPARAYPMRYLTWHEIVNDTVAGVPVAVTFCPLCNTALVFDRRVEGGVLTFGVSGNLRHSDMVMFDRETESWWQQATGQGIVGPMRARRSTPLVSWVESWESFLAANPDGLVMAEPGANRPYGRNPYVGYDSSAQPFLFFGEMPPHGIPPLARVVRVGDRAWPLTRLAEEGAVTRPGLTITWAAGKASALDAPRIAEGRDVGQIRVRGRGWRGHGP